MKKLFCMLMMALLAIVPLGALAELTPAATEAPAGDAALVEGAALTEGDALPTEAPIGMINPWVAGTEEEVAAALGAQFTITPPEGFTLADAAYLTKEDGTAPEFAAARYVYSTADGLMMRVNFNADLAATPIPEDAAVVNGAPVVYNAEECSISYVLNNYLVTIDVPDYTQGQLVELMSCIAAPAIDAPADDATIGNADAPTDITVDENATEPTEAPAE